MFVLQNTFVILFLSMIVFGHHIFAGSNGCEWGLVGLLDGVLNYGAWVLEVNINLLFEYRWEMF